jgi:hypothetical protein
MEYVSDIISSLYAAPAAEAVAPPAVVTGLPAEGPPSGQEPQARPANQALLNLTCSDMEKVIYAKLGWDRDA